MENTSTTDDEQAIKRLLEEAISALEQGDLEKALTYHSEDVVLMEQNLPAINNKQEMRELFTGWLNDFARQNIRSTLALTILELEVTGNRAFARGKVVHTKTKAGEGPVESHGKFLSLFKKQEDGSWLRTHIVSNSDGPVGH